MEDRQLARWQAQKDIEALRRRYALATDQLGASDDPEQRKRGLQTYHEIFHAQATMTVTGGPQPLMASGPNGWAEVATRALRDYESTQHLIGTQLVTFTELTFDTDTTTIVSGTARLSSYVQAWHAWPDRRLRLVIGTYLDDVVWQPQHGWQIHTMDLVYTTQEHRILG